MEKKKTLQQEILNIAIPVALQSLLSSSFSVVDQIMTGQLGEISIAGIGLAGKFAGLHSVVLGAVATVAGILLAQHLGKRDQKAAARGFFLNLTLALAVAAAFTVVCESVPRGVMGLYTTDSGTRDCAARYLQIIALGFLPSAGSLLLSTFLRCKDRANIPLYATLFNAALNTGLNYVLIFGKFGFPAMGVSAAAWATVISQYAGFLVILTGYLRLSRETHWRVPFPLTMSKEMWHQYLRILAPILVCEFFWGLGENVYAAIYGHIGTGACAAMTLISPVVVLFIGALSGVSQAAGILIGKRLGAGAFEEAYALSKKLMWYGLAGSLCLGAVLVLLGQRYVQIFRVENSVRAAAYQLLVVFAAFGPVKVQNMILGGGIIRSGGETRLTMYMDLIGTWLFGVPLGVLSAFVLGLPIAWVYALISLEECVRLLMAVRVFRKRNWMVRLEQANG